jgi:hypothetical protein
MKIIFTPQVFAQILSLVEQGLSAAEIAAQVGCTLNSLRVRCSQQGIRLRRAKASPKIAHPTRLTVRLSRNVGIRLEQQASKQGLSATRFATNLLEAIVRDDLYNAVIDQNVDINSRLLRRVN